MLKQLQNGYGELVKAVIRPPRANYEVADLGPASFRIAGRPFQRRELKVKSPQGMTLECSWWEPADGDRAQKLPCVVYLHGNSGSRMEALANMPVVLGMGMMLFAFDFSGCGLSDGEYITLGYKEKDDLQAVIEYLRSTGKVSTLALWGRSMGAATALLHGHRDPGIAAMVIDSPFASLERLAKEIVDKVQVKHKPEVLVKVFTRLLRLSVLKKGGLDILKLKPIEKVSECFIPTLFVAGNEDQFIPPRHASDIHDAFAGEKSIILVEGGHNGQRPAYLMDTVSIFFYSHLCLPVGLTEDRLGLGAKRLLGAGGSSSPSPGGLGGLVDGTGLDDPKLQATLVASLG